MSIMTVIARITAKPGSEARLERELRAIVAPTRAETGCLRYDLHRSLEDGRVFLFFERWASEADLRRHGEAEHTTSYRQATRESVESFDVETLEQIG